MFKHAHAGGQL